MENNTTYILIILLVSLSLFLIYLILDNSRIKTREVDINLNYEKRTKKTTKFKILQISDFHNQNWGKNNTILLNKIKNIMPDYIFISGDFIDREKPNVETAYKFLDDLNEILDVEKDGESKIFYVYGNHEKSQEDDLIYSYEEVLKSKNITLLKDEVKQIVLNDQKINILGMDDPLKDLEYKITNTETIKVSILDYFNVNNDSNVENLKLLEEKLVKIFDNNEKELEDGFNILLTHRPEGFPVYSKYNIDLVLAGHAHGGLARIPFTNISLIAPNQQIFPKYTKGPYVEENTVMYVSLGLKNWLFPFRVFATPDVIVINIEV